MKISLNWISQFSQIEKILNEFGAVKLAHLYSIHTAEIDGIEYFGTEKKVVVGKILEVNPHPDSDHLNVVNVDLGNLGKSQIVCGAANVIKAKYVPVATPGAILGEGFEIKTAKLRGVESNGMICSEDELGFREDRAEGIMILEEIFEEKYLEENLGKPFFDLKIVSPSGEMKISDIVFEIDNKFITNRPDLFSIEGNAREFGAIFDIKFNPYEDSRSEYKSDFEVKIETDNVESYHLYKINNVNSSKSPFVISYMLHKSGISSKFDLVDMTNFVMTELGQPMHAFDANKIKGDICVRMAKKGEKMLALNGNTYELQDNDIVIADSEKILAIAGIIGGESSAISENTKDIYLESACFDPASVRLTAQRLAIRTDSSTRYEKSLDPLLSYKALNRALEFLDFLKKDYKVEKKSFYLNKSYVNEIKIGFKKEFIDKKIGIKIEEKEILRILSSLGFKALIKGDFYEVLAPSWRATKDISIKEDIAEEIGRIYSYEKVKEIPIFGDFNISNNNKTIELKDKIIDYFCSKGFFESYNYSFLNETLDEKILIKEHKDTIKITNAFSNEFTILRRNLLAYLIKNVSDNIKNQDKVSFFEIGKVFEKNNGVFDEKLMLAGISYKNDFLDFKSTLEGFLNFILQKKEFKINQKIEAINYPYFHPNKSGEIIVENNILGNLGYINPIIASNFSLDDDILYFEINFKKLLELYKNSISNFSEISKFPSIDRELNFVIDEKIPLGTIIEKIESSDELIRKVSILDIYRNDEKIGKGKKSVNFSIIINDHNKTITLEEALVIQNKIIEKLTLENMELRKS